MNWVKSSKCTSEALTTGCQSKRIGDQEAAEKNASGETTFPTSSSSHSHYKMSTSLDNYGVCKATIVIKYGTITK